MKCNWLGCVFVELIVHSDTLVEVRVQSASIGYATCARRVMDVNIFMSMTCPRCHLATSSKSLVNAIIVTASTFMWMPRV